MNNNRRIEPLKKRKENRIRKIDDTSIEIELTRGQRTVVDAEDYWKELHKYKFCAVFNKRGGVFEGRARAMVDKKSAPVRIHQIIAEMHGYLLGSYEDVDHLDGNSLNNLWSNLAPGTHRNNACNRKDQRDGTKSSQHPGVSWHEKEHKYRAQIQFEGRPIHLKYFDNEEEAAKAYEHAKSRIEKGLHPKEEEK